MILDIQNVSCRYTSREKDTLTGVNLRIEEGEMVLIAGRSGCGKSTLVKAVTGLLDKEDGSIDGKIFGWKGHGGDVRRRDRRFCGNSIPNTGRSDFCDDRCR